MILISQYFNRKWKFIKSIQTQTKSYKILLNAQKKLWTILTNKIQNLTKNQIQYHNLEIKYWSLLNKTYNN